MSLNGIGKLKPTLISKWSDLYPDTHTGEAWKCPNCGKRYVGAIKQCEYCGLKGN